jgi:protein-L-isoaspartate O-methyltransferase
MAAESVLHTPAWRAAVEEVPRYVFVPRFYVQQSSGGWVETAEGDDGCLESVYRNEPLITALAVASNGNRVTVSSSTKPGLMVRMLEAMDVRDEHRVLEIGTGTGYNDDRRRRSGGYPLDDVPRAVAVIVAGPMVPCASAVAR